MNRRVLGAGVKRGVDVVGAALELVILSPILAWTAVGALLTQGRPILFRQVWPGLHGKLFTICKFRTMRPSRPGEVWYLNDDERLTRLGRFLRTSSLDELPELWNALRGDMSLVGRAHFSPNIWRPTRRKRDAAMRCGPGLRAGPW